MQRLSGLTVLKWGEGKNYAFKLGGREIEQLEKIAGASISSLSRRIMTFEGYYREIKAVVILGLEGGGKTPVEAQDLWDRFCEGRPLNDPSDPCSPVKTAAAIMDAAWFGVADLPGTKEENQSDESPIDIAAIRAKVLEFGASPEWVNNASMHELLSTFLHLSQEKGTMTGETYDALKLKLAERKKQMGLT